MILNTGICVRLLGIKSCSESEIAAQTFLKSKVKNSKVFLRFDQNKYDSENNLLAYVYLKNKTFLNVHLLKEGLVEVDLSAEFGLKNKFININHRS